MERVTRTAPCPQEVRRGRLRKANQFFDATMVFDEDGGDGVDVCITLFVHAGIAASDVICCAALGEYPRGESHQEAVALLAKVDRPMSRHLETLLRMKTKAGYTHMSGSRDELRRARRAATELVERARAAPGG